MPNARIARESASWDRLIIMIISAVIWVRNRAMS